MARAPHTINPMRVITLTTDFGLDDWFVGTMKGVILGRAPRARLVDLTHGIAPGDIAAGAFALAAAWRFFPRGTVHLAVVDPGVGGPRPALAAKADGHFFLGPDNGLLTLALRAAGVREIRRLENARLRLRTVSRTFHGRDVFAPAAAWLAAGGAFAQLGPLAPDYQQLPWPEVVRRAGAVVGEVVYVDRFGNAITNLDEPALRAVRGGLEALRVWAGRRAWGGLRSHYQAVPPGARVALIGSTGFLELAINGGSAAGRTGVRVGTKVRVDAG
jgi:S-adenosylmethionine hydrolase